VVLALDLVADCIVTVVHASVSIQLLPGIPDLHSLAVGSGYLGAALGMGMVIPQIARTVRNRAMPGVSALSWSLTAISCSTWLLYGIRARELPQIPGNVVIVSGAVLIALLVPSVTAPRTRAARLAALLAVVGAVAAVAPPTLLGLLAFAIGLVSSWPQLITSLTRPVHVPSAVSISAWLMRCASQAAWLFYALVLHDLAVTIAATVTLTSALVILAVELRRRPATTAAGRTGAPAAMALATAGDSRV
jgi:uncharacterized protein with PQ loop repeat